MKSLKFIFGIIWLLMLCSCSNKKKLKECLPGHILIMYIGEVNKPPYSLLMRTNENDTTYFRYTKEEYNLFSKDEFADPVKKYFFRNEIITNEIYSIMKQYILDHNTQKDFNINHSEYNAMKLFLSDKCDSTEYIVDETDIGYFSGLIDTLKSTKNETIFTYLNYYKNIQENNRK